MANSPTRNDSNWFNITPYTEVEVKSVDSTTKIESVSVQTQTDQLANLTTTKSILQEKSALQDQDIGFNYEHVLQNNI